MHVATPLDAVPMTVLLAFLDAGHAQPGGGCNPYGQLVELWDGVAKIAGNGGKNEPAVPLDICKHCAQAGFAGARCGVGYFGI